MMNDAESPNIRLRGALGWGCLTGMLAGCLPALLCGIASHRLVHNIRQWIMGWEGPDAELSIGKLLGGTTIRLSLDFQKHLNVTDFMQTLEHLDRGGWWFVPLLALLLMLLTGAALAVLSGVGAGLYNCFQHRGWFTARCADQRVHRDTPVQGMAWLALAADPARRWPLRQTHTRVGSGRGSHVRLTGTRSRHAEIRYEGGKYRLYDLSGGQTWLGDQPVTGHPVLQDRTRLRFGAIEMIFHLSSEMQP